MNIEDLKINVNFVNKSDNPNPRYETSGASGFDIRAYLEEAIVLLPMERRLIPTGLYFNLPPYYELQVRARSGLALKHGISLVNGIGSVDNDYKGEVGVILINLGEEPFTIENGDRIAQGVLVPQLGSTFLHLNQVDEFNSNSERGSGGFGSTGVK